MEQKVSRVIKSEIINIKDFETFITEIYRRDGIADWKIARKRKFMKNFTKEIGLITFAIDDPNYRRNRSTGSILSHLLFKLSLKYDNLSARKWRNYFGDIARHGW